MVFGAQIYLLVLVCNYVCLKDLVVGLQYPCMFVFSFLLSCKLSDYSVVCESVSICHEVYV